MANVIEAIRSAVDTIIDDENPPLLNIMEASFSWQYYALVREAISFEEAGLNTTDDDELKGMLKDALKLCKGQAGTLEDFMRREGVPLPPVSVSKPLTDSSSIPPGVKLTNDEIANGLALKVIAMSIQSATAAAQSVRTDMGSIWTGFLVETLTYGSTLKTKMRKRGWAKIPPGYSPPGV